MFFEHCILIHSTQLQ